MSLVKETSKSATSTQKQKYTAKDFQSDQDVRWCPGCGDYSILAQTQRIFPELGVNKENIVFVSGIGCSSRFPYYMQTYGIHGIHGRAPAIASGLKMVRPDLSVWVVTGDGDGLSIGGNHLIHILRRNLNVKILLFNNQIYGLTKGQYSPTSEFGKVTKSTPYGSIDYPFHPVAVAIGASGTFVARSMDRDPKHLQQMIKRAHEHQGCAFIEIYQNCNVFNDGAFFKYTEKETRGANVVYLEHSKPLVFGEERDKAIQLDAFKPRIISLKDGRRSISDALVYDEKDPSLAFIIASMVNDPELPRPMGVFLALDRPVYEDEMEKQIAYATKARGEGDLKKLLHSGDTWLIQ